MGIIFTIFGSIVTVVLGAFLANAWQRRNAREARFYEATKLTLDGMLEAHRRVARNTGRRVYAAQRVMLTQNSNPSFQAAVSEFREANLQWNNELLLMEIDVLTLFKGAALIEFEALQSEMALINIRVSQKIGGNPINADALRLILYRLGTIRNLYFAFIREMIRETDILFRQMHYGVIIDYDREYISKFTTWQLFKSLWSGPINQSSVLGAPDNFGEPVRIDNLRLGIH